jgi:hypothetical protein
VRQRDGNLIEELELMEIDKALKDKLSLEIIHKKLFRKAYLIFQSSFIFSTPCHSIKPDNLK